MRLRDLFDEFPLQTVVVPMAVQQLLQQPLNVSDDWHRAEQLLLAAKNIMPERPEIMVALYKLYAYSNRFAESQALIDQVLVMSASRAGFNPDWRQLTTTSARWSPAQMDERYYLYSLKAMAFVLLRQGRVVDARLVLDKIAKLDVTDQVGSSVLLDITQRLLDDDYDYVA